MSQSVTYGSGSFSGNEFTDTVSLGSGLTITRQSIGVATRASGFSGVDGILGSVSSINHDNIPSNSILSIGPVDLTSGTLSPSTGSTIPTGAYPKMAT